MYFKILERFNQFWSGLTGLQTEKISERGCPDTWRIWKRSVWRSGPKSLLQCVKAPGPDNIPGRVLGKCVDQLACVLTDIFNTYWTKPLYHHVSRLPPSYQCRKKPQITTLSDYRPVALNPGIMMKGFESLVKKHIMSKLSHAWPFPVCLSSQTVPLRTLCPLLFT